MSGYDQYFAMARGVEGVVALDMSKFFDTNYHYMVPELDSSSKPAADWSKLIEKVRSPPDNPACDLAPLCLAARLSSRFLHRHPRLKAHSLTNIC